MYILSIAADDRMFILLKTLLIIRHERPSLVNQIMRGTLFKFLKPYQTQKKYFEISCIKIHSRRGPLFDVGPRRP